MQLFSRAKRKVKTIEQEAEYQPLDPVALSLALWLGMMACAFGLIRLASNAAPGPEQSDRPALSITAGFPLAFGS
jgi:hypothetical protein